MTARRKRLTTWGGLIALSGLLHAALLWGMAAFAPPPPHPASIGATPHSFSISLAAPAPNPAPEKTDQTAPSAEQERARSAPHAHAARAPVAVDPAASNAQPAQALPTPAKPAPARELAARDTLREKMPEAPAKPAPPLTPDASPAAPETAEASRANPPPVGVAPADPRLVHALTQARARKQAMHQVRMEFARHFRYPPLARRNGWEGTVVLSFRVTPDGRIDTIEIAQPSGHRVLDRAARDALARVGPLHPPRSAPHAEALTLELAVSYQLKES